jgi:hypothetical protein
MPVITSPTRFRLLLVGVLVIALASLTVAVRASGPAAAADCGIGATGSASCFTLSSGVATDRYGGRLGNLGADTSGLNANELSADEGTPAISWQLQISGDHKSFTMKNLNSALCLQASVLGTSNNPAALTSCPGPSRFKFAAVGGSANVARLVSVDTPGYCLDVLTDSWPYTEMPGTIWLMHCSAAASQQWHLSGPTTGAGAGWPKSIAMQTAFINCADASWTCRFRADDGAAKPQVTTTSSCLAIAGGNPTRNGTSVPVSLSASYATTVAATQTLGTSFDQSVGFDALLGAWGLSASIGWGYSSSQSYTHADTDTSSYTVSIPAGKWGWLGSTEFTAVGTGTWTFDLGTSYEWSDHETKFSFPDLSTDHPYGHVVTAGVGPTKSTTCQ